MAEGASSEAVQIVQAVTKPSGFVYLEWISDLAQAAPLGALRVKLADNADNTDPARVALLPDGARRVTERYAPARDILLDALRRRLGEEG